MDTIGIGGIPIPMRGSVCAKQAKYVDTVFDVTFKPYAHPAVA